MGLLRTMKIKCSSAADMVPVDFANNAIISLGWVTALSPASQPIVYNYTSGDVHPVHWSTVCKLYLCKCF